MKRAAAKIQLDLNAVVDGYTVGTPMFRMVNYNTSTRILEKGSEGHVSVTEMEQYVGNSNSFNGEDGLYWNRFVAYSYSFSWAGDYGAASLHTGEAASDQERRERNLSEGQDRA